MKFDEDSFKDLTNDRELFLGHQIEQRFTHQVYVVRRRRLQNGEASIGDLSPRASAILIARHPLDKAASFEPPDVMGEAATRTHSEFGKVGHP